MATTKRPGVAKKSGKGGGEGPSREARGSSEKGRPRLRSSHEVVRAEGPKPKAAASRAPKKRARAGVRSAEIESRLVRGPGLRSKKPKGGGRTEGAGGTASDAARELAIAIAIAGLEKKAVGTEILDVAGKVDYADFLVIMTGRSDRQVAALAQGIEEALRKKNVRPLAVEGLPLASWVLMDFGDVVVHVFQDDARSLYDIEGLWMDARRVPVPVPDEMR